MRIANVDDRLVIVRDGKSVDVERATGARFSAAPQEIFERWDEFVDWAAAAEFDLSTAPDFDPEQTGPPVTHPRQVFAIGLNYREHAAEANENAPSHPPVFTKFPTSITSARAVVELPSDTVDWEVELVVVIGKRAYRVPESDAWGYVAGLTIGQDLSERTVQLRPPLPQFSFAKSFPGFSPIGPELVTIDELADPDDVALSCSVGGDILQHGRTSQMIFSIPRLIAELSAGCVLLPGDLIFTGTPAGVGVARTPQRFLKPGEVLVTEIEGLGRMSNPLVAAPHYAAYPA